MRHTQHKMKGGMALLNLWCVPLWCATGGCQPYVKITWNQPARLETEPKILLAVGDLAELKRTPVPWDPHPSSAVIGKHTVTVFGLPAGNISTHESTPLKPSFDHAIRDALEAAGYELVDAADAPADAPVLRGEVNACWWWSYSWFWPVMVQGGENKVTLYLDAPDGANLWKHAFSRIEPGVSAGVACGFDLMMKWSMTKLVEDIVRECSTDEFKTTLGNGTALAAR